MTVSVVSGCLIVASSGNGVFLTPYRDTAFLPFEVGKTYRIDGEDLRRMQKAGD